MEPVDTPEAVSPIGPYSQAFKANGFIFTSGQIPANARGEVIEGGIAEKTHAACKNVGAVLKAAGSSIEKAIKINVFVKDIDDVKVLNSVYAAYFPHNPARTVCQVSNLPANVSLMIEAVAVM